MRLSEPRVPPIADEDLDEEGRDFLRQVSREGRVLNIYRTLAAHPKLLKRWGVFGTHVLYKSTLPARERELLILRTGWLCRSEYEWGQHVIIAKGCGITEDEIERVKAGPRRMGGRCSTRRWCEPWMSCTAIRSLVTRRGRRFRSGSTRSS